MRKATVSFVMSVCLSVRPSAWNNSSPTRRIVIHSDILWIYQKSVEKTQVSFKLDKTPRVHYMKNNAHL